MLKPYDFQIEAIEAAEDGWRDGLQRLLIVLPTGTGKTLVMGKMIERLGVRTLILESGIELVHQTAEALEWLYPDVKIGILQGKYRPAADAQIIVASVQTLSRKECLDQWKDYGFELIICDEAHHVVASTYQRIVKAFGCLRTGGCRLLGLTATGKRGDHVALGHVYQDIVYNRTLGEMIIAGYLVDFKWLRINTDVQLVELSSGQASDFDSEELEPLINTENRNRLIVEAYLKYSEKRKTLCFATSVNHAISLAEEFRRAGIRSAHIHGDMFSKARKQVLDEFKKGFIEVLTNFNLLIEGYDQPDIRCLIMGRPTRSWTLYMQMLGRGVRKCEGKTDCLIMDVADVCQHHDIWDLPTLLGEELKDTPESAILKKLTEQDVPKPLNWKATTESQQGYTSSEQEVIAELIGNKLWAEVLELIHKGNYSFNIGMNRIVTIALSDDEKISMIPEKDGFQVEVVNQCNLFNLTNGVVSPPWAIEVVKAYLDTKYNLGGDVTESRCSII